MIRVSIGGGAGRSSIEAAEVEARRPEKGQHVRHGRRPDGEDQGTVATTHSSINARTL